jgi:hypothetical protein
MPATLTDANVQVQRSGLNGAIVTNLLTLTGTNFQPGDLVQIRDSVTLEGLKVVSGFVSPTQMQVTIPPTAMASGGGFISVLHYQPPDVIRTNELPLFLNPGNQAPMARANDPLTVLTYAPTATAGGITASVAGSGHVAVAYYGKVDPTGTHKFGPEAFYGSVLSEPTPSPNFLYMHVTMCSMTPVNFVKWWNGFDGMPVRGTITRPSDRCFDILVNNFTSPSVHDFLGTYIAVGNDLIAPTIQATATTAPGQVYTSGTWTSSAVTVSLMGQDQGGSGYDNVYYSIDDPTCTETSRATCKIYNFPFSVSAPGSHNVFYFVADGAGNTRKGRLQVNISTTQG